MEFINGTQLVKYKDLNYEKFIENRREQRENGCGLSLIDQLGEYMLTDSHNSLRKLQYILGRDIEWSDESLERNHKDFSDVKLGHYNDHFPSFEDVITGARGVWDNHKEKMTYGVSSRLEKVNKWNFEITQDVYHTQRVNVKVYGSNEVILKGVYHKDVEVLIGEVADFISTEGNDLLLVKLRTETALIVFSIKEGRYLMWAKANDEAGASNEFFFGRKYEDLIKAILGEA